jgi:hypothetical protein
VCFPQFFFIPSHLQLQSLYTLLHATL